jgi:uncharacterized protein (DUF1800 family)
MRVSPPPPANHPWSRLLFLFLTILTACSIAPSASAQVNGSITQSVWQMLYGVSNAQVNSPAWLAADDDGDGISNGAEMIAGTNPFKANSVIKVSTVSTSGTTVSVSFATMAGKLYTVQATSSLSPTNWQLVSGASVVGDGTTKTVLVAKSAGEYFRVVVQDQSSMGDGVGDWAKLMLGYSAGTALSGQSGYTSGTLATALAGQNVVTVTATDASTTQPVNATTAASDFGLITFTRSGYQLLNAITVPIQVSGSATAGADYSTSVNGITYATYPASITFPAGINSVALNITPLYNAGRVGSTTVTVTAQSGVGYTLGAPASAGVTINPPSVAGAANGTGLLGTYYIGSAASYTNSGTLGAASATYSFTQASSTAGSIVVTYTGAPAVPYAVGSPVTLTFTSGNLNNSMYNGSYTVSAIGTNTFTIPIAVNGISLPSSGAGAVTIASFAASSNASNFGGIAVTYNYTKLSTTSGTAVISYVGTPAVPFAINGTVTLQFISGFLYTGVPGLYDGTYTITAVSGGSGNGSLTVAVSGTNLPSSGTGNATLAPFTGPIITEVDPTVDFLWGTGQPSNASLQTATNNNWAARWGSYVVPASTGTYYFNIQANDGGRVYVNGSLIIDAWSPGSSSYTPMVSAAVSLTQNVPALIQIEYYHLNGTAASVNLGWKTPGSPSFSNVPANISYLTSGLATNGWSGLYWSNMGSAATAPHNSTVTISIASPAVVTWPSHGLVAGTPVIFSTTGTLPTGLTPGATYYVLSAGLTSSSFEVSTIQGGSAVATTGSQSGVQTAQSYTAFYGLPRYGDYPTEITNLSWSSQPSATLPNSQSFSIRWDGYLSPTKASTATISIAAPAVVTWTAHGLTSGTPVVFTTTGALPTGLTAGTTYYVITAGLTANAFEVSTTLGGSAVATSGSQSGTQTVTAAFTDTYTFDVQASDGARVYLDPTQSGTLTKIIDAWTADSSATTPSVSGTSYTLTAGQQYHIRVEYYQAGNSNPANALVNLRWKNSTGTMAPIPAANVFRADPMTAAGTATSGLWATYYNNATLTEPPLYAVQDTSANTITNNYGTSVPSSGNLGSASSNNWAGRFDSYLKVTTASSTYQFQLAAQSAGRLVINGAEAIPFTAGTSITSSTYSFTANQIVPIRVEFYDTGSSGSAVLSWGTSGTYATIPASNFFQDAAATIPGVVGNYWTNTAFEGYPSFADYQTQINYSKGSGQPGDIWSGTAFSATWDGYLSAATTGSYIFSLQAQSQARVYVNGTLVVDGWSTPGLSAVTPITGSIALTGGTRVPFHVDYATGTTGAFIYLMWQPPTAGSLGTIPNNVFFRDNATNPTSQQGLLATYYANTTQTAPYFYQVAENNNPELNYFFGGSRPTGLPASSYTVRWTGQVLPQYTEPYYFTVKSDDGARLWVNGQLIIDKWQSQSIAENISSPINLVAGVLYDIKLEYLQLTGSAEVHLNWYSADQAEQIIPMSRLFPNITGMVNAGPSGVTSTASDVYVAGSGTPYSYTIAGSNIPSTYTATGLPTGLTLNGNVLSGTPTAPGIYQFTITTNNISGASSQIVTLNVLSTPGNITREIWGGLSGPSVSDLQQAILSGTAPTTTDANLTSLEDTLGYANNTGERLRGYFTAPSTGNYYFWIAASGTAVDGNHTAAELWISNSNQTVSKVRRAYVSGPTGTASRTWNAQTSQKSPWLALVGGQQYYFEVLHNTGSTGGSSNLSVGWFLDPTGNTANPLANGSGPAPASAAGIMPGFVLSPWDNPPTTTTPGLIYLANLAGVSTLSGIKGSGGAYITVNGTTGIVHLNYSGLTSSVTSQQIYAAAVGNNSPTLLFDLGGQNKNYPNLRTSDGGYTWNMQPSDLTNLQNGKVFINLATVNNQSGELVGTFGAVAGSQTPPSLPSYTSPSWTDDHATNLASNSRFLTQATFGPSPSDMTYVQANGYRSWIENQFMISGPKIPSHNVPYVLAHLTGDPQNPYYDSLFFNSWWNNSINGPDQLRQRIAFALSEILVTSDVGPLNNNGRNLADYYDTLVDYAFTDFRTLLKQVTLTSAMGVYLNMQGNGKGSYVTGLHPNENYAREIMQLFSIGLYRLWPDGSLMLDNNGEPIPTYDQTVITGMARVFTGWTWGQALSNGRLPTNFYPASNYLDPMVLVSTYHELGAKILLDNVMLPAAIVTSQTDTSHDPNPNPITIQSTDPVLGQGNLVSTSVTSSYDLNGLNDLDRALSSIVSNVSVGPFICRQLIQRLVTSNPTPDYVYRVVRAFNGERNFDGISTGVVGDLKDTIRAILLDPEARSATEAVNAGFGKQREPLLRVTGPARAFPVTGLAGSTYRQLGGQVILITTPTPHRLSNGDTVLLDTFVDSSNSTTNLPYSQGYSIGNTVPSYTYLGSSAIATISAPGYKAGDNVQIQFTSGVLGTTSPYNAVQSYTVISATTTGTSGTFTVNVGGSSPPAANTSGSAFTPYNFTVNTTGVSTPSYSISGTTVTITGASTTITAGQQLYVKFTSGSLLGAGYDTVYIVQTASSGTLTITLGSTPVGTTGGSTMIPSLSGGYTVTTIADQSTITLQTANSFDVKVGDQVWVDFLVTLTPLGAQSGLYTVTGVPGNNLITILSPTVLTAGTESTNGMVAYPLNLNAATRNGTLTVDFGTWNIGNTTTNSTLDQSPLNSATVFNFFYPNYAYAGPVGTAGKSLIAQAGMTTPEFQITDATDTMNLTNAITAGILNAGNTYGFASFFSGGGAIVMDLGSYMNSAQTQDSGIPGLVSTFGTLLTAGNLGSTNQGIISNYVLNNVNATISAMSIGNPCTITTPTAHNLTTGTSVTISGITGGTFSPAINGTYTVTVTSPTTFTVPVNYSNSSGISLTNAIYKASLLPNTVMRDRIRAILQLILTSAEYAIQK